MPDKININAVMAIATVAAICRTRNPIGGIFREEPLLSNIFPFTEITPDFVKSLTGHI
jgi:hypothetical protein